MCSASRFTGVMLLILKPHLILLIPAQFLAQSGQIDVKVIICRVQLSRFQGNVSGTATEATERGKSCQDGLRSINRAGF